MVCAVLPRPISSARKPPSPWVRRCCSQFRPCCWYGRRLRVKPGGGRHLHHLRQLAEPLDGGGHLGGVLPPRGQQFLEVQHRGRLAGRQQEGGIGAVGGRLHQVAHHGHQAAHPVGGQADHAAVLQAGDQLVAQGAQRVRPALHQPGQDRAAAPRARRPPRCRGRARSCRARRRSPARRSRRPTWPPAGRTRRPRCSASPRPAAPACARPGSGATARPRPARAARARGGPCRPTRRPRATGRSRNRPGPAPTPPLPPGPAGRTRARAARRCARTAARRRPPPRRCRPSRRHSRNPASTCPAAPIVPASSGP